MFPNVTPNIALNTSFKNKIETLLDLALRLSLYYWKLVLFSVVHTKQHDETIEQIQPTWSHVTYSSHMNEQPPPTKIIIKKIFAKIVQLDDLNLLLILISFLVVIHESISTQVMLNYRQKLDWSRYDVAIVWELQ